MKAQLQILQNLFSLATQPTEPFGHVPFCILGHFSQAIPQTPIPMFNHSIAHKRVPSSIYRLKKPLLRVQTLYRI
jgi:hypothetical protein